MSSLPQLPTLPKPGAIGRARGLAAARKGHQKGTVGKRSKTQNPICSDAMHAWKTSGMTSEVAATLGKCRSIARQKSQATLHREAGNEARAQHLEHRAMGEHVTAKARTARARQLVAERVAKRGVKENPTLKEQVAAHRAKSGMDVKQRAQLAGEKRQDREADLPHTSGVGKGTANYPRFPLTGGSEKPRSGYRPTALTVAGQRAAMIGASGASSKSISAYDERTKKERMAAHAEHEKIRKEYIKKNGSIKDQMRAATAKLTGRTLGAKPHPPAPAPKPAPPDLRPQTRAPGTARITRAIERVRQARALREARASGDLPRGKGGVFQGAFKTFGHQGVGEIVASSNRVPIAAGPAGQTTPAGIRALNRVRRTALADKLVRRKEQAAAPAAPPRLAPGRGTPERSATVAEFRTARQGKDTDIIGEVRRKIMERKGQRQAAVARERAPYVPREHIERVKHAFEAADREKGGTNFVKIHDVRRRLPGMSRTEVDATLRHLRETRQMVGSSHEGLHGSLTPGQRRAGIKEGRSNLTYLERGEHYVPPGGPALTAPRPVVAKPTTSAPVPAPTPITTPKPVEKARAQVAKRGTSPMKGDDFELNPPLPPPPKDRPRPVVAAPPTPPSPAPRPVPPRLGPRAESAVHDVGSAYHRLSGGRENVRVRIADIKEHLKDKYTSKEIEDALRHHEAHGDAALYRLDNPPEITARDRAAMMHTPSGEPRHIVYMGGNSASLAVPAASKPTPIDSPRMVPKLDPATFAGRVKSAVATVGPEGRFGDNKVFISHAHAAYERLHGPMPLAEFKSKLAEANNKRHLDLSRADMVEAMHGPTVRASETRQMGAEFHFIRAAPRPAAAVTPTVTSTVPHAPSAPPSGTHARVMEGLSKIFKSQPIDDRGMTIQQIARNSGIPEGDVAAWTHAAARKGVVEYDHYNEHDAAHARKYATVHTDPMTGRPIAAVRIMRPKRLHELGHI